jgi:hypothetical protein
MSHPKISLTLNSSQVQISPSPNLPKSKFPQCPKAKARFKAEICHNSIQNIRVVPKTATVEIHTTRKHGVKSDLKGLSGVHPSALAHSSCRHGVKFASGEGGWDFEEGLRRRGSIDKHDGFVRFAEAFS